MIESIKRAGKGSKRVAWRARNALQPQMPPRPDWWAGTEWQGLRVSGLFDESWYRAQYDDAKNVPDALWHYVAIGAARGHDPNPLFSTTWYLAAYPDVAVANANPLLHYYASGAIEARDPGPGFDTGWYLRTNPDLDPAVVNPLGHFLVFGDKEGRSPRAASLRAAGTNVLTVVCVSGEADTPGHHYRVLRFAESVERMGGRAIVLSIDDATGARLSAVDGADAVLVWRTPWEPRVEQLFSRARRAGAAVIFDVDDLMFDPSIATVETVDGIRSQGFAEPDVREMFARVRRTAANSDACTCPTPALAERLRHLHVPVYVLPNGFDDAVVTRSRLATRLRAGSLRDGLCRIGYAAGSRTHQRDFGVAAEGVARVLRAHDDARLVLYRRAFDLDEFPVFDDLRDRIEWRDLVPLEDLPHEMARYDVNLAPLEVGNPFCEAKSALKFFEAALVDVPTIASPTQPFREVIRAGETGYLADCAEEWYDALERLVADGELRAKIARAARDAVLWEHGVEHRTRTVKSILDQVLDDGMVAAAAFAWEVSAREETDGRPELTPATVLFERDSLRAADVTVVVPVFNYEALVTDALESVRQQTLTDLDLVVVDDASTDGSRRRILDWLELHASRFNRVVFLGNGENAGLARARNNGFDAAETPYVLPLDADNVLLPKCCEHLLDALRITNAAFAYPRIRQFGELTDLFRREHVVGYLPWVPQRLVSSNYIDAMALVRKDSWFAAGGYRQGLRGWEDYDLWCRFAERGSYGLRVPEELARYRVHRQSMLHTETNEPQANPILRADMSRAHPWLALDDRPPDEIESNAVAHAGPPPPIAVAVHEFPDVRADDEGGGAASAGRSPADDNSLSARSRELLPILRCPETGEPLEEVPGGGVRSAVSHRAWPVVAGRPVLFPGRPEPEVFPEEHLGNPLPERARALITEVDGLVLHLSGGGTVAGGDRVIDLDAAIFGPTDIVGDSHVLPFADATFDLVIAMNAFEHYRDPRTVVAQIERVLKPGGRVFLHTAFLQPVHEAPHHYFNCTSYGLREWFAPFETIDLRVSENFHPGFALSWLASDVGELLETEISPAALQTFRSATIGEIADYWRDPRTRDDDSRWSSLASLPEDALERVAAGFEYLGRRRRS